jgi:Carboxypeptidase regulatory-like domain
MTRKLAWWLVLAAVSVPAFAGANSGSLSGYVKNSAGIPQMGAIVEIFGPGPTPEATVFTDVAGFFKAAALDTGTYHLKVTAPSFLPALRENVSIRSGATQIVNVTLNTLYEAIQFGPARKHPGEDEEDWKWTLRSMASRPVLRVLDNGPVVVSKSEREDDRVLKARVAFIAGAEGEGTSGAAGNTVFDVETSMFSGGKLNVNGNLSYNGQSTPATVLHAVYSREMLNGTHPEIGLTARRFALPYLGDRNTALQALALSASDDFTFMDVAEVKLGGEYQAIQLFSRAGAFKPFANVDLHLGPSTIVEYAYATTQPTTRASKGFDTAPADLSESGPRMSLQNFAPVIERAQHHEVSVTQKLGEKTKISAAWYEDSVTDPALTGVGSPEGASGDFLPDMYAGTFTATGRSYQTNGLRFAAQRKLVGDLIASLDYSLGGALELAPNSSVDSARSSMITGRHHSASCKVAGSVPITHTKWIASYRWSNGTTLTPVDQFNASFGQADPYFNIFVRQPVPTLSFMPKMEALVDVRNLLAQGYTPVMGTDGRMLYLVQSARALRGGVSFSF